MTVDLRTPQAEHHLQLERESLLWLESGERCTLAAGDKGVEFVVAHAPDQASA